MVVLAGYFGLMSPMDAAVINAKHDAIVGIKVRVGRSLRTRYGAS